MKTGRIGDHQQNFEVKPLAVPAALERHDPVVRDGERPLKTRFFRIVCVIGLVLALSSVLYFGLFANSYFPDNCYNYALALRSASPQSTHFLETSLVYLFFERYPIPREEDWHRGLSVIVLKYWAQYTGPQGGRWMRVPHLLWIAFWVWGALKLLDRINGERAALWTRALLVFALLVGPWAFTVLGNSYLDDVPSAGFVLAGLLVLTKNLSSGKRVFAAGVLFGLAFLAKDFALLWLPILCASLALRSMLFKSGAGLRKAAEQVCFFGLGYALICTPRILWDIHSLGGVLANPIQYWIKGYYFGSREGCYSCFAPFFLFDDESYRSILALSGGLSGVLGNMLTRSIPDTAIAFVLLGFAWVWLPTCFFPASRTRGLSEAARFLRLTVVVALAAYAVFFGLGKGEAVQLRYWAALISLALVTGMHGLNLAVGESRMSRQRRAGTAFLVLAAFFLQMNPLSGDRSAYAEPFLSQSLADTVSSTVSEDESAMFYLFPAFQYWSMKPQAQVVLFWPDCLMKLTDAQAEDLFTYYRVRTVCLTAEEGPRERLHHWGFVDVPTPEKREMLLVRKTPYHAQAR